MLGQLDMRAERDPATNILRRVPKYVFQTQDQETRNVYRAQRRPTKRGHGVPGELPILAYLSPNNGRMQYLTLGQREACVQGRLPDAPTCPNPPRFRDLPPEAFEVLRTYRRGPGSQ